MAIKSTRWVSKASLNGVRSSGCSRPVRGHELQNHLGARIAPSTRDLTRMPITTETGRMAMKSKRRLAKMNQARAHQVDQDAREELHVRQLQGARRRVSH